MGPNDDYADLLYSVFIDDTSIVPTDKTRAFVGAMFETDQISIIDEKKAEYKRILSEPNEDSHKFNPNVESFCTNDGYEMMSLPKVRAGVAHAPFTNGFMSSILMSLKVNERGQINM